MLSSSVTPMPPWSCTACSATNLAARPTLALAADVASVVACLEALADFAQQNADVLDEVDLNPIKALPQGRGCVVVDALIVARAPARG